MNNTLEGSKSKITEAEEWVSDLEDRMVRVTVAEQNIEERMKKNEDSLKDFWTAAKSLQSCPTLCDPIDGSPPGSPVPGILQARTLEWVAISFSNA